MELIDHVRALCVLFDTEEPVLKGEVEVVTNAIEHDIAQAKSSRDMTKIATELVSTVLLFLGEDYSVLPAVHAFVGHVLKECPDARGPFSQLLGEINPTLPDKFR